MKTQLSFFVFLLITANVFAADFPVTDYGARADTSFLSTQAIQKAIDECSLSGGGRVVIPSGNFKTGTIILKDNVTLHLEKGATLYGSRNIEDYLPIKPDYVALRTKKETRQLIFAEKVVNTGITGEGTIDGQGDAFESVAGNEGITRPHLIQIIDSENIEIHDVTMRNSGAWMQHYLACENVQVSGITIFNHANRNNDGLDLDGCKNVTVSDVIIDSDDDGIVLKSTSGKPSENITITNCVISSHCNGIKMGTESNGGFKNITISNCVVKPSSVDDRTIYGTVDGISGIALEIVDGGTMQGILINNIRIQGTQSPIFVRLGNRARPYSDDVPVEGVGEIKDVIISNVVVNGTRGLGCSVTGIPGHPVENIQLSNISVEFAGGGTKDLFEREIPEREKAYPEANMFGHLPAYGFFIRHANGIKMSDITLTTRGADARPALYLDQMSGSSFRNFFIQRSETSEGDVHIQNSDHIIIDEFMINNKINLDLQVSEINNGEIEVDD